MAQTGESIRSELTGAIEVHEVGGSLPGAFCGSHLGSLGMQVTAWRQSNGTNLPHKWGWDFSKDVQFGSPSQDDLSSAALLIDGRPLDAEPIIGPHVTCRILGDWDAGIDEIPEVVAQAMTGMAGYVGPVAGPPMMVGTPVITMTTGVAAIQASLAALYWHRRTDVPCTVTVTAVGAGIALLGNNVTADSDPDQRDGFASMHLGEPDRGYPCRDGVVDFTFWRDDDGFSQFCRWLGRDDLAEDERFMSLRSRSQHSRLLSAELGSALGDCSVDDVLTELENVGAIFARRYPIAELANHPQVRFLELVRSLEGSDGVDLVVQVPFAFDKVRPPASAVSFNKE